MRATAGRRITGQPVGIGPNAITRVAEASSRRLGAVQAARLFGQAGLARHWLAPPTALVDEREVDRLHRTLRAELGEEAAAVIAGDAGAATADYLIVNRIPRALRWLLRLAPPRTAARVLLGAISRHAWTFVGSGRFTWAAVDSGNGWDITIHDNPLCRGPRSARPTCHFYRAAFERLFSALVSVECRASETRCEACGDDGCRIELRLASRARPTAALYDGPHGPAAAAAARSHRRAARARRARRRDGRAAARPPAA